MKKLRHMMMRRRNQALLLFACINVVLIFLGYSNLITYPHTTIGSIDVSGKTAGEIRTILSEKETFRPKIQVKNRQYQWSYTQLGIVVDTDRAINDVFAPNRKFFPVNLAYFVRSLFIKTSITPPLAFTQQFEQFVSEMIFNFGDSEDNVSIDETTKSILVEENSQTYRMNQDNLEELLLSRFGTDNRPIYPQLSRVNNETIDQVINLNQRLDNIFSEPIIVYLDLGGTTQAVELKEEDIREATNVTLNSDEVSVNIDVNPEALNRVLIKRVRENGFPIRENVVTQNVRDDFLKAVTLRFHGSHIAAVSTKLDDGPNTNGTLAQKYIEVDISQQKMYLFQDGKMRKSYKVSTGLDYPTPVGHFTILNKVGLGFSDIYNVWLPWWMGFSYSEELHAYFGIHEQPYILTEDGKPIIRGPAIGTPSTGGCVALSPGAAREVYAFGDVGTEVYIYN